MKLSIAKFSIPGIMLLLCSLVFMSHAQGPAGASGGGRGGSGGRGVARVQPDPVDFNDHPGWTELFDGNTLNGWDGNPDVWSVVDGAIVGAYNTPVGTRNTQTFLM